MDEREPWYIRYGGGYLAYLFYVVPVLIAVGAGMVWNSLYSSFLDRYWVESSTFWLIGWYVAPILLAIPAFIVIWLLFLLGKSPFGRSSIGKNVLICTGVTVVFIAIGMFISTFMIVLSEG